MLIVIQAPGAAKGREAVAVEFRVALLDGAPVLPFVVRVDRFEAGENETAKNEGREHWEHVHGVSPCVATRFTSSM